MGAHAPSSSLRVPVETGLLRAHGLAALAMVGYVALLGVAASLKLHMPEFLGDTSWLTWGRLRYAHTQGVFFGWLGNAFLAFLYYAVPRLAERPVTSRRLGWLLFVVWNFLLVIPGWALVQAGFSQPLEWGEFPLVIDGAAVLGLLLATVQFTGPFFRTRLSELYVAGWYILGGLVFTLLAYPVGNFVPEIVPGARGAAYSGLWIHDAVGLFVTPLAVAIAYIVIPEATRKPIFSHFLSMVGFWLLFLVYPLNGTHHFIFSPIPMEAQQGAVVASVYLGADVILVVANLLLSLRGSAGAVAQNAPLRFVWLGVIAYLVVSLQGSMQALMPFNRFVHFSDWVIGHSHLAMIGFASFTTIGGLLHAWQRSPGLRYNPRAADWCFWLLTVGTGLMVVDLTAAGLIQGQLWASDAPWMASVRASEGFWLTRTLVGVPILLGFVALALALVTGPRTVSDSTVVEAPAEETEVPDTAALPGLAFLRTAYGVTAIAGLGFFVLSFLVLAVWPNEILEKQIAATRPPYLPSLSDAELRGRAIYGREGCLNCHSQVVRSTTDDVRRFGIATAAWEGEGDYPHLWGTRRIGPDLARESGRRPRDWHLVHLWKARDVVPDSIMPPYPWLFDGSPLRPTQEALDLVAYLDSLGRDAKLAGLTGPRPPANRDPEEEERLGMFCDCAVPRTTGAAPLLTPPTEASERARFRRHGAEVFTRECRGCHGPQGRGDGPAAVALFPQPRDLTSATFANRSLSQSLWHGIAGSSMPGWSELPQGELVALMAYVQSLDKEGPAPAPPLEAAEETQARALYTKNCAACHGEGGTGNGAATAPLAPLPSVFRWLRPTQAHAEAVLAKGVPGTSMPPWEGKLSLEERRQLARYVRSLFRPDLPE